MDIYGQIARTIKAMGATHGTILFSAEVKSVNGDICTLKIGALELTDVRLRAVADSSDNRLLITPKQGSQVIVADLSGGDYRDLLVLAYSEIETIDLRIGQTVLTVEDGAVTFNEGNQGLVKIQELTDKLNDLITTFNAHTHTTSLGPSGPPTSRASSFNKNDYEDTKVKH